MKYILAFVPPDRFDSLVDELSERHVHGLSISRVQGFGQEHDPGHPEHRDHAGVDLVHKMRGEVICNAREVDDLPAAFYQPVHTGRAGAGKPLLLPADAALRLKTRHRAEPRLGHSPSAPPPPT